MNKSRTSFRMIDNDSNRTMAVANKRLIKCRKLSKLQTKQYHMTHNQLTHTTCICVKLVQMGDRPFYSNFLSRL